MTLYTFAQVIHHNGHGGASKEDAIVRTGAYGTGAFPPMFKTIDAAKAWLVGNNLYKPKIVTVTLVE